MGFLDAVIGPRPAPKKYDADEDGLTALVPGEERDIALHAHVCVRRHEHHGQQNVEIGNRLADIDWRMHRQDVFLIVIAGAVFFIAMHFGADDLIALAKALLGL